MPFELNYNEMVRLDAEDLAETGLQKAYMSLLPMLRQYVPLPADIEEVIDDDAPRYAIRYRGKEYVIYSPDTQDDESRSWGIATYALFSIVNEQLANSTHRFYAIEGGNDLGGMFLTPAEADSARQSLPRKTDWPYLPNLEDPWYGQNH